MDEVSDPESGLKCASIITVAWMFCSENCYYDEICYVLNMLEPHSIQPFICNGSYTVVALFHNQLSAPGKVLSKLPKRRTETSIFVWSAAKSAMCSSSRLTD